MKREEGFYLVKLKSNHWTIAFWRVIDGGAWTLNAFIDDTYWLYDHDFIEINETKIELP